MTNTPIRTCLRLLPAILLSLLLIACDKKGDTPDNEPTMTDTVAGIYHGRLIQGSYSGPTITADTVNGQIFTVVKVSETNIHIHGFGEDDHDTYYLYHINTAEGNVLFSGEGSNADYSFTATFWVDQDSVYLDANKRITTGTGMFWRFDGKKE